ncbi:MAG: hypothetical protein M1819_005200 [Sarea resinae]|nr:MAG: hypothetical protein M1819_005200 [Sarea resinae]
MDVKLEDAVLEGRVGLRRRRRSSANLRSSPARRSRAYENTEDAEDGAPTTPRKRSKRVRFTDPGPEITELSSTGLTPAIRRSSLGPKPGRSQSPRSTPRRSKSPSMRLFSTPPISGEIQFEPLRTILDARTQRRLSRNHLSEETNDIDAEKKRNAGRRRAYEELKREAEGLERKMTELRERRDSIKRLDNEAEAKSDREKELEQELMTLKAEMREDTEFSHASGNDATAIIGDELEDEDNGFTFIELDDDVEEAETRLSSFDRNASTPSPTKTALEPHIINADTHRHPRLITSDEEESKELRETVRTLTVELERSNNMQHRILTKIRQHLSSQSRDAAEGSSVDSILDRILTDLALSQSRAADAEVNLSFLKQIINALGFEGSSEDEMLNTLQETFYQARLELEYIFPGETTEGFENSKLLDILINRIRALILRVNDGERALDQQQQQYDALRGQFDGTLLRLESTGAKMGVMEKQLAASNSKLAELLNENDEQSRSFRKLQNALEGYRQEVSNLEALIVKMEQEHHEATLHMRREMDEAVADLESKAQFECQARKHAESATREQRDLVTQLQEKLSAASRHADNVRAEMQALLATKEESIASLQQDAMQKDLEHDTTVSNFQSQIALLQQESANLNSTLQDARTTISSLQTSKTSLEAQLAEECEEAKRAIRAIVAGVHTVEADYLSQRFGSASTPVERPLEARPKRPFGLLTPQTDSRFKDVDFRDGSSKPLKRKRYDSGIGVVDEEEEEE